MTAAPARGGSRLPLLLLGGLVLLAFYGQRCRSSFLAIEAQVDAAAALAARHGLRRADVFALFDLAVACGRGNTPPGATTAAAPTAVVGDPAAAPKAWAEAVAEFAALQPELGAPLAAVALAGELPWARQVRSAAADADAAWVMARTDPRALAGLRFLRQRDRFAARAPARD